MLEKRVARRVSEVWHALGVGQRCRTWRRLETIFLTALLGSVTLPGCSDFDRRGTYESSYARGGERRGAWSDWHPWRPGSRPPAGATDAGVAGAGATSPLDAGLADAGDAGTATPSGTLDAGTLDAGAIANDAGAPAAVLALSDSQLLFAADAISADEITAAEAAASALTDPDVQAFAAQLVVEHQAIRATLQALATSLALTPAASGVSDDLTNVDAAAQQALVGPDAGALDTPFLTEQVAALTRALILLGQLEAAADTAPLRAELVVLQSLVQQDLEKARQLSAG